MTACPVLARADYLVAVGIAAAGGQRHADSMDISVKLQLKPVQQVAVLNPQWPAKENQCCSMA
jgi:hypothetical protein